MQQTWPWSIAKEGHLMLIFLLVLHRDGHFLTTVYSIAEVSSAKAFEVWNINWKKTEKKGETLYVIYKIT